MSLACVRQGALTDAALMVARAARIGYLLRAAVNRKEEVISPITLGRMNHILRASYCLDAILSARLNIPLPFPTLACTFTSDVSEDDTEEWVPIINSSMFTAQAGPLFTLSTFNQLSHSVQSLTSALRACQGPSDVDGTTTASLLVRMEVVLSENYSIYDDGNQSLLPHKLTVLLVRHVTLLLLTLSLPQDQSGGMPDKVTRVIGRLQDFCTFFISNTESMDSHSISPIWELLWAIVLEHFNQSKWPSIPNALTSAFSATLRVVMSSLSRLGVRSEPHPLPLQLYHAPAAQMLREEAGAPIAVAAMSPRAAGALPVDMCITDYVPTLTSTNHTSVREPHNAVEGDPAAGQMSSDRVLDGPVTHSYTSSELATQTASHKAIGDANKPSGRPAIETQNNAQLNIGDMSNFSSTAFDFLAADVLNW